MDPATQRMLERARARRQMLDEKLASVGLSEGVTRRRPLRENTEAQFVTVTTEVEVVLSKPDNVQRVNVSPTKVEVRGVDEKEKENVWTANICEQPEKTEDKTGSPVRPTTRTQLKRLGELYSDSNISSPIHRTENTFAVEEEPKPSAKKSARVARLAALADNIKQWEDDLSHPSSALPSEERKENNTLKEIVPQSLPKSSDMLVAESPLNTGEVQNVPRRIQWDEKLLSDLEAQGFSRSVSNSRLSYDYSKHASQDGAATSNERCVTSLKADTSKSNGEKSVNNSGHAERKKPTEIKKANDAGVNICSPKTKSTPEKALSPCSPLKADLNGAREKLRNSPLKIGSSSAASPKSGFVFEKASLFESTSPTKPKPKDPAELSVSERMALFERNKGQALVPKAAFSMAVPAKYLDGSSQPGPEKQSKCSPGKGKPFEKLAPTSVKTSSSGINQKIMHSPSKTASPGESSVPQKVLARRNMFEQGVLSQGKEKLQSVQSEREKEIAVLRNRWNTNKSLAAEAKEKQPEIRHQKGPAPPPPPPPPPQEEQPPMRSAAPFTPHITEMIPKASPSVQPSPTKPTRPENTTDIMNRSISASRMENQYRQLCKIKKIRVSPPKPGHIYPCLSDIEATTTETESEVPCEYEEDSMSSSDSNNIGDTSFGREILEAAGINNRTPNKTVLSDSDSSESESAVMESMDDFLDEALGYDSSSESDQDGPTPPKKTRDSISPKKCGISKASPTSRPSKSFRYTAAGNSPRKSPTKSPVKMPEAAKDPEHMPNSIVDGNQEMPLMHSVSFYRKQQHLALKTPPVRQIVRQPPVTLSESESSSSSQVDEAEEVRKKITELLDEVAIQQSVISQASQALNLCTATVEFSGSEEQVEGERVLLLATHKRQATLNEIQRLKVEGTLKPMSQGTTNVSLDKGSLLISKIVLPLKKEYVAAVATGNMCFHFVCLVRSQEQVVMTKVMCAVPRNLQDKYNIVWDTSLRLVDLYSDFKVTFEVYSLQTAKEVLPHNIKYHIGSKKDSGKSWLTPKKLNKQESRLIMPSVHSPAGPTAVRSPEFRMAGYVVFSLKELQRTNFTLNKVSFSSPLEGNIQLKMSSELCVDVHQRGFLTMFEDVSGFGAWHRRWFVLQGTSLAYWKYPDDEKKVPIGQIDLNSCTTENVGLVSRDICARPHTFLLETTRPAEPDDKDSLVMVLSGDQTIIRNLLSADTKEERVVWCSQLNKSLSLMRAWGSSGKE